MPYQVKKQGDKYVVYKKDTGKRVGATAGNKEALRKYLAALHLNANESIINLTETIYNKDKMKLINLIPLREVDEDQSTPELMAIPYFREFQTAHGYKPMFKFLGVKNEENIFVADLTKFGMLDLIVTDAKLYAKVTEKYAVFGVVYTLSGLESLEATVCLMKQKDGQIERIMFDNKDKKNFNAKANNFIKLIEK